MWLGWSGGADGGKAGESGVLIRMYDVSDLAPPLEKRDDQLCATMYYSSTGLFDPIIPDERSWRIVGCNLAATELSKMVSDVASAPNTRSDSLVHCYCYGGRLLVVGTEESQRRVLSVLRFVRQPTAAGGDATKGDKP
ncbi:MAG: hypothetical protein ACHRHE_01130 [Tepidisphaerales bacterium]